MAIKQRLGDARGPDDLSHRRVLIAVGDEELFGVSEELLFPRGLVQPAGRFDEPASLGSTHPMPFACGRQREKTLFYRRVVSCQLSVVSCPLHVADAISD